MVVLSYILPTVKEIYGPFWSAILDEIQKTGAQADLYALHASLRLLSLLRKPYMLESNDDLLDAWSEKRTAIAKCLVGLLWQLQGKHPTCFVRIEPFCPWYGYKSPAFHNELDVTSASLPPLLTT